MIVVSTPKLNSTISAKKLLLFAVILLLVPFTNITNAQRDYYNISEDGLLVTASGNVEATNNDQYLSTDSKVYIDFTEDDISAKDELNFSSRSKKVQGKFVPITGNVKELYKFFRALKGSRTKKIRIAHYGDSILLGDVITENLRQNFQDKFGGDGLGFLSIKPDDIRMKRSVRQNVYGNWIMGSITKGNPKHFPIGISGLTEKATRNSRVKFQTTKFMRTSRSFKTARIFYSNAKSSSSIKYSFESGKKISRRLQPGTSIKQLVLNSPRLENSLDINFGGAAGTYFYGVSFESGNGIYVDNFPLTGNSGVSLTQLKKKTLQEFDQYLNYKLIIIQFGVNATQLTMNFSWYRNKMVRVINHFKKAFPSASILVVSVGDKSIKRGSRFVTDPKVLQLLKTQKEIVAKTNVAFWNLYEAMGGKNSLNRWVNAGPPLGLRDYIHFTNLGGKVVADLLTRALMKEYNKMR
ncbi:MAG TPA: hypothetical protein ENI57_05365 [Ignavibacteria bacterium]|nr:hypothetical protein [Ignavibacteria bacterium]